MTFALHRVVFVTTSMLLAACASAPREAPVEGGHAKAPASAADPAASPVRPPSATPPGRGDPPPSAAIPPPPNAGNPRPGGYYKDDGPGDNPRTDLASIPDATPRQEPLHRFANRPYVALGQSFTPRKSAEGYKERGKASWYGKRFHGRPTSSGEPYDMYAMTAAHPTLPIPSYARVTELNSGKSVIVRINDRGPFHKGRVIDLSYTAAWKLGYVTRGSTDVEVESITPEGVSVGSTRGSSPSVAALELTSEASATPLSTPEPVAAADGQDNAGGIFLQLGSFSSSHNADSFGDFVRQEMKDLRADALGNLSVHNTGDRHRLQLGPFASEEQARELAAQIAKKLKLTPFVVYR